MITPPGLYGTFLNMYSSVCKIKALDLLTLEAHCTLNFMNKKFGSSKGESVIART